MNNIKIAVWDTEKLQFDLNIRSQSKYNDKNIK